MELPLNALTPRMRRILIAAGQQALAAQQSFIGTEHVLLALAQDGDGIAGQVLAELGVRREVEQAVLVAIEQNGPGGEAADPGDEALVELDPAPLTNHPLRVVQRA